MKIAPKIMERVMYAQETRVQIIVLTIQITTKTIVTRILKRRIGAIITARIIAM